MKIVFIADTHGYESQLVIPNGDVLVHAGDFSAWRGSEIESQEFDNWLGSLPHKVKIFVPGNHDYPIYEKRYRISNAITLEDSFHVVDGIKFYGFPWQPSFSNWAYHILPGQSMQHKVDLIPKDVDVLISHSPPFGILDELVSGRNVGIDELAKWSARYKPTVHAMGHIHEGYGKVVIGGTTFLNCSICDVRYNPVNKPKIMVIKDDPKIHKTKG